MLQLAIDHELAVFRQLAAVCLQVHDNCSRAPRSPLIASQAENRRHWLRNFLMHGFHMLVMVVVGGAIHDTQCGFKVLGSV